MSETLKLPLWKNVVEELVNDGITYGSTYETVFFETRLREKRETLAFGIGISQIRSALLERGLYLSGQGQKGHQFVVLEASANADVMRNLQSQAIVALRKGVILGTNTRVDILTIEERRKHESMLEKLAIRAALISRRTPTLKRAMKALN